ncbi:UspA domain protein [Chlorobaculum parvum NCIB 8327]|uniref:UspA domain protein n=1 Tax=Chlorobaculum parvum (strain DSM 263 / NCIMB 8327) TaxID=517417 RepID=B3QRB4_CHLP8|nr:universal stress protein [Chlorobaculum parvum]ACF10484.1 UspA domain protein [Chlorobaculum parvum NCIB 8327]
MTNTVAKSSRTILCPTDFSVASTQALLHAAGQCGGNAELIVLHIGASGSGDHGTMLKEHLHNFSGYSDLLSGYGCRVRFAVEYGTPSAAIIEYAEKADADLIVMGSHGASDFRRLLVGSTAEAVMRQATRPVLVLRSPKRDGEKTSHQKEQTEVLTNSND